MKIGIEFETDEEARIKYDTAMAALKEKRATCLRGKKPNLNKFDKIDQRIYKLYEIGAVARLKVGRKRLPWPERRVEQFYH